MARMTLREAAARTARSVTTLRRYIRSGRLHAEKRDGRFGPEYFVSDEDLAGAGLEAEPPSTGNGMVTTSRSARGLPVAPAAAAAQGVPLILYQELQMKHEQLLVQYGMIRAGGLRAMELSTEVQTLKRRLDERTAELERLRREQSGESRALKRELRAAHLELEGRALQIAALEEKIRGLEMLTRNTGTRENIDKQFREVMDQSRKVGQIRAGETWSSRAKNLRSPQRPKERERPQRPPGPPDAPEH